MSIVTISYNQAPHLEAALDSVLSQRGVDLDYIVVDPGSTDGSRETIRRYEPRLSHAILQPDDGPADGLNKGFALATGDIFGYLNSDDRFLPNTLRTVADLFEKHPDIEVWSGHAYLIDYDGRRLHRIFSGRFDLDMYAEGHCILVQQSTFFRASAYRRTCGFNVANRLTWDGELAVDLALTGARFGVTQRYLSEFRVYPGTMSTSPDYYIRLRREQERLRARIGSRQRTWLQSRASWVKFWLGQPNTLARRVKDGIFHPRRIL